MNDDMQSNLSELEQRLNDFEQRLEKLESSPKGTPVSQDKELTIRQFLNQKKPANDNQRTLAIGYYLEKYDGLEPFNKIDLEDGYISSREKVPANILSTVKRNIDKKLIILAKVKKDGLKAYLVGNDGIEMVEAGF